LKIDVTITVVHQETTIATTNLEERVRKDPEETMEIETIRVTEEMTTEEKEEKIIEREERIGNQEREEKILEENLVIKEENKTEDNEEISEERIEVKEAITDTSIIDKIIRMLIEERTLLEEVIMIVITTEDRVVTTTETIELNKTPIIRETLSTDLVESTLKKESNSVEIENLLIGARYQKFYLEMTH